MSKKVAVIVVVILFTSIMFTANAPVQTKAGEPILSNQAISSLTEYTVHDWGISVGKAKLEIEGKYSNLTAPLNELLNSVLRGFDHGKMTIVVGKVYEEVKIAYIAPMLVLGNDIEINETTLQLLSPLLKLNASLSTIPTMKLDKGTGVPVGTILNILSEVIGVIPGNLTLSNIFNMINFTTPNPPNNTTFPTNLTLYTSTPYNYSQEAILPPMPLLDPNNLPYYASIWSGVIQSFLPGIKGTVINMDDAYEFRAHGTNTTQINNTSTLTTQVKLVAKYNKTTGIEEAFYLDLSLTYVNGTDKVKLYLTTAMKHINSERLSFALRDGDSLKLMVTDLSHTAIPTLLENVPGFFNITAIDQFLSIFQDSNVTFTYYDAKSQSGIDLFYNILFRGKVGQNSTQTYLSALTPISPYILPTWELQASMGQLINEALATQIVNLIFANITSSSPNTILKVKGDYRFLLHGTPSNFDYAAILSEIKIFYRNVTRSITNPGVSANMTIKIWFTYSKMGYLTEIGGKFSIDDIAFDTNGNGDFSDEAHAGNFYYKFSMNRVTESASLIGLLGETIVNPPDPDPNSSAWSDATPKLKTGPIVESLDSNSPSIFGVKVDYNMTDNGVLVFISANVSDDSGILNVTVNYWYNETVYSGELQYNEETGNYTTMVLVPSNTTELNITVTAFDIFGNVNKTKVITLQISHGEPTGATWVYVTASFIVLVVTVGLIIYFKRKS